MNREQAQKEYLELLNKKLDEEEKIIESAKRKGVWREGLDSNRELFAELDAEYAKKIEELKARYKKEGS